MGKKAKSALCSSGWCVNHLFELLPLKNTDCHYRRKMKLRLCPKLSASSNAFQKIVPIVNNDRRHYTPCFILEEEQVRPAARRTTTPRTTRNC